MVDIQTISIAVASASVTLAAIYYVWQVRHQTRIRHTDIITKLANDMATNQKFIEAFVDIFETQFKDYDDFVKKYGEPISRNQVPMSYMMMGNFFEQIGVLFKNGLIDATLVSDLFPIRIVWEKMKPLAVGMREKYDNPEFFVWFEYLYGAMKKREQKLQQSRA